MKTLYNSCKNALRKDESKPEKIEFITNYMNKFNIDESIQDKDQFTTLLANLHNNNIDLLFEITSVDSKNPSEKPVPNIKPSINSFENYITEKFAEAKLSEMGYSQYYFSDRDSYDKHIKKINQIIEAYKGYVRKVLTKLYDSDENKIDKMVETIIEVEDKLTQYYLK